MITLTLNRTNVNKDNDERVTKGGNGIQTNNKWIRYIYISYAIFLTHNKIKLLFKSNWTFQSRECTAYPWVLSNKITMLPWLLGTVAKKSNKINQQFVYSYVHVRCIQIIIYSLSITWGKCRLRVNYRYMYSKLGVSWIRP